MISGIRVIVRVTVRCDGCGTTRQSEKTDNCSRSDVDHCAHEAGKAAFAALEWRAIGDSHFCLSCTNAIDAAAKAQCAAVPPTCGAV